MLLGDFASFVREQWHAFVALCADDIVIAHSDISALQQVLNVVIQWLSAKGLDANTKTTKATKFCRGGGTVLAGIIGGSTVRS